MMAANALLVGFIGLMMWFLDLSKAILLKLCIISLLLFDNIKLFEDGLLLLPLEIPIKDLDLVLIKIPTRPS